MRILTQDQWEERTALHRSLVGPLADGFIDRRARGLKHPVTDFLFTYYRFSPGKLKEWVPSFEEALEIGEKAPLLNSYWFKSENSLLFLNKERLQGQALFLIDFIIKLCDNILEKTPRFGCFGLHEWAMVYRLSEKELRHADYPLRLSPDALARFVESQSLSCTHYDAYRFFTPQAKPLNLFKPDIESRLSNEQGGCLHANMDIYKWATKLWPWIGSDFIGKAFLNALYGRELDMRASPYDLSRHGYMPIRIETEEGRKEYQQHQQKYALMTNELRKELKDFCSRLSVWRKI